MRYWSMVVLMLLAVICTQCGSDKKSAEKTPSEQSTADTGTMAIEGSSIQINWIRGLTESFKSAELAYSLGDTTGAIGTAESLLVVAEQTMDTLPPTAQMSRFILVFTSDVYSSLRKWYTVGGFREEAQGISQRYIDLADRMQARRDSAREHAQ